MGNFDYFNNNVLRDALFYKSISINAVSMYPGLATDLPLKTLFYEVSLFILLLACTSPDLGLRVTVGYQVLWDRTCSAHSLQPHDLRGLPRLHSFAVTEMRDIFFQWAQ